MQKNLPQFLAILMLIPFISKAEWIPLNKQHLTPAPPNVMLISDDNTGTVLKIDISGFDLQDFTTSGKTYQKIDLLSESFTNEAGYPELAYIAKVLAIPDQAGISVEVLATGEIQTFDNIYLPPARESWSEGSPETPYTENTVAYNSMTAWPAASVKLDPPSIFRDFRITRVAAFPMRYIPGKKQLQVASSMTVRVNYGSGPAINPKTTAKKPIAPSFGKLYQSVIFNYESVLNKKYGGKEDGHDLMLCIMPDEFTASFQVYANWKKQSGIDIHVTKFSDIGANASNPDIIKNHIADAYHNWEVPPTYVLIIGDDGFFPKYLVTLDGWTFPNEDYFVEIDGDDYFPELMIGRFTNQGDYRLQVMINKFIKYEKTPYVADTNWFKKGVCCSNNAYSSQVETKRYAADRMLQDGDFTSVDTMMSKSPCLYNLNDVINAVNSGRSYLNYRGEGWYSGWSANCYGFSISDVNNSVNNGEEMTFVTSIGCGVAMFDSPGNNCFGEAWVEVGSLSEIRGAPAFLGPTSNTHTAYNNNIDRGIYKGMFQEGMDTPGQALLRGKLFMYNVFGDSDPFVEYHFKIYCALGDPSIHIWKDVPKAVTVIHPTSIPFGNSLVEVTVNHTATGQPVENAVVCITGDTIFATATTDATGKAYIEITAETVEDLTVTVRGGNVYPYQGTISVLQPAGPYVIRDTCVMNDVAGGNGNGIMETAENLLASLTVKNVGLLDATNVLVTISTSDENIEVTDSSETYGTIAAGNTAVVSDGFGWTVADDIPDLHKVIFEVNATDGTDNWTSFFDVTGHAPLLDLGMMTIDDASGNGNGRLDPGETVNLLIPTHNDGTFQAAGTIASLNCLNGYITLNNATYDLGTIAAGSMGDAVFNITVSPDAPVGTGVIFNYIVASGGYSVQDSHATSIGLIVEDWESGTMNQFGWTTGGSADWAVSTDNPYEGNYCIQSGDIGDNQNNYLSLQYAVASSDSISFWFRVSSETNYDFLKFYIDNNEQSEWSGEVGWMHKSYAVTSGIHSFKWEYDKDYSVSSGSDCAWVDFIILPASVLQASFVASETEVCEGATVNFYDQSPSGVMNWDWTFEGGTPATSTLQNPTILYSTAGIYDVSLTVSNGSENNTLTLTDYITVNTVPVTPSVPSGPTEVCGNTMSSPYSTTGSTGTSVFNWLLEPSNAGSVTGTGPTVSVEWSEGFLGDATLKVSGENDCGTSPYSTTLNISRYLPDVTLEPFGMVCINWPAFELTGGMPEGGVYSGPGVDNGWFDPSVAGLGMHPITYTFIDLNNCENFAVDSIYVDPCTGIDENYDLSGIRIYPNPTTGMITIDFEINSGFTEIKVLNTLNKVVYSASEKIMTGKQLNINLSGLKKGIYFIKINNDRLEKTLKVILQ